MHLIVIGGGAAGFFCAVNAAGMKPSLQVTIVEKTGRLLSKVRISGGGRCNVTHACYSIQEMARKYPRGGNFVKKTFHQFFTSDTVAWFKERGVALKTEDDGRMFPVSDTSETIIRCLLNEADRYRVAIKLNREVKRIEKDGKRWKLTFGDGTTEEADFVCVACGGYPKTAMFEWILATGHTISEPVPSLFTFNMPNNPITTLMGIAVQSKVKIAGTKLEEEGALLITHWGLSGPAVLKLSARAARELNRLDYRFEIIVNWLPEYNEHSLREAFAGFRKDNGAQKVAARNAFGLPHRLWEYFCTASGIGDEVRWGDLAATNQNALIRHVCLHEIRVEGKTTFKEEFVTAGGIVLKEVDPVTMQSRLVPNLYFAGEILDVDGVTGGFNFQHAWTSGWIAAKAVSGGSK